MEASSPVLIEKVRTAATDDEGRYRLIDPRPGTYTLTFAPRSLSQGAAWTTSIAVMAGRVASRVN